MRFRFKIALFIVIALVILYLTSPMLTYNWLLDIILYGKMNFVSGVSVMFSITAIGVAFIIFLENRNPARTLTWIVALAIFPVFGFFFYLLFGQSYRKKRIYKKKSIIDEHVYQLYKRKNPVDVSDVAERNDKLDYLLKVGMTQGNIGLSRNTKTQVLTNGSETFPSILEELKKAKHHIHMEFYIVRDDDIGTQIKDILIEKAKQGVEVRFLYDGVGSWQLSRAYKTDLIGAGVQIVPFSPVKIPILNDTINYRNHRKIVVIDGHVGFVGGLNIGDEYLGKDEYYGKWRDTHLKLIGEAVQSLQVIFLQDWFYMTNEIIKGAVYFQLTDLPSSPSEGVIQIVAGGPDNKHDVIKQLFFAMITNARKNICIMSPYFVPDDDLLTALKVAANAGVKVQILVPDRPDKKIVFHASRSYFPELLEAGVEIYEYKQGFLHGKILMADDEVASIGTANMDMRSFHLNFEITAFLYLEESIERLAVDFQDDLKNSRQIKYTEFLKRPMYLRIFESLSRLLAPLL